MHANQKVKAVAASAAIRKMSVVALGERGRVVVSSDDGVTSEATIAVVGDYAPRVGDKVLAAETTDGMYVVGVLVALREVVPADPIRVRDAAGRLLFEHDAATGKSVLYATGDVEIAAPEGSVRITARDGVRLEGDAGQASLSIGREIVAAAPSIRAVAASSELSTGSARIVARTIETAAETVKTVATVLETRAERILERAKDAYREVDELSQTRAGRVRMLVGETFHLLSKRFVAQAEDDVKIDGRQIYLG